MNVGNFSKRRKAGALALALALVLVMGPSAFAEEPTKTPESPSSTEEKTTTLEARFLEKNSGEIKTISVPYSDDFFSRNENVFYDDLAQASFGMTVSAYRDGAEERKRNDMNIVSFFTQAGFKAIKTEWYDKDPTGTSIATAIASKKIGDFTIIAMVCSGQGYEKEWISNLTLGTGTEHEGFYSSAAICEERLRAYIEENQLTGKLKLWTSGFSRASAVGNALAANMMESGLFDAIYGYFYATPNNTRNPVAYENLFNIVGQNDPVAQVPLTCWGYGRNGVDKYTPAQESNSDYITKALLANVPMMELNGESFRNNPQVNWQIRVVLSYLGEIFPTAEDYATILQPQLIAAYEKHGGEDLIALLREALANVKDFDPERQIAVNSLGKYLDSIVYDYVSGNKDQKEDGSWADDIAVSFNLALEHVPATYYSWIFSQLKPEELFEESTGTIRLVFQGDFDLEVFDKDGIVQGVTSVDEESVYVPGGEFRPEGADTIYLYAQNDSGKAVLNLPCDREYTVQLKANEEETVSLFSNYYKYGSTANTAGDLILFPVKEGERLTLSGFLSADGTKIQYEDGEEVPTVRQEIPSNTQSLVTEEMLMEGGYSISDIAYAMLAVFVLPLVLLLITLLVFLIGRKREKGGRILTVLLFLIAVVYASGAALLGSMLSNFWYAPLIPTVLAVIFSLLAVLKLRKWNSRKTA